MTCALVSPTTLTKREETHLEDAIVGGMLVVVDDLLLGHLSLEQSLPLQLEHRLQDEVRVDTIGAVANEDADVVDLPRLTRLNDKRDL